MSADKVIVERYRLERQIARGGMGSIWRAEDERFSRPVAIKFLSAEDAQDPASRARFDREIQAVGRVRSHHIVEVFDHGVDDEGRPFLVMELLEGQSLSAHLGRANRLSANRTATLLAQICRGLRVAHDAGIVHRDLKPSNVFLAQVDESEVVKLLDFGVAKPIGPLTGDQPTTTGTIVGTPQYMSPEQLRNSQTADHRADVWSVAVITFRMMTGVNPFMGNSVPDAIARICFGDAPVPKDYVDDLPASLDEFFRRAFARDPDQRFGSARELAAEFVKAAEVSSGPGASGPMASLGELALEQSSRDWPKPDLSKIDSAASAASAASSPEASKEASTLATPRSSTVAGAAGSLLPNSLEGNRSLMWLGAGTFVVTAAIVGFVVSSLDDAAESASSSTTPAADARAADAPTADRTSAADRDMSTTSVEPVASTSVDVAPSSPSGVTATPAGTASSLAAAGSASADASDVASAAPSAEVEAPVPTVKRPTKKGSQPPRTERPPDW